DAAQYLREALDLEPTNTRARALLVDITGGSAGIDAPLRPEIADALGEQMAAPESLDAEVRELSDEIEVEEPTGQVDADRVVNECEEAVSSAIELYPEEIEFEDSDPAAPVAAQPFGAELHPQTEQSGPIIDVEDPPETLDDRGLEPESEERPRFGRPPDEEPPRTLDAAS